MEGGRNTRIWLFQNGAVHGLTFSNFHLMIAQRQAGTNSQDQDAPRLAVLPDLRHRSAWHGAWWAWSGFSLAGHPSESSHIPRHPCARGRIVIDLQRIRTTSRQPRCPHAPYFHCLSFFFGHFLDISRNVPIQPARIALHLKTLFSVFAFLWVSPSTVHHTTTSCHRRYLY